MISSEKAIPPGSKERSRWEVTDEMIYEVEKYVEGIRNKAKGGTLFVEKRVEFGHAIGLEGAFGTTDAAILSANGEEISVDDLKYGYTPVGAELNPQLMHYAIGTISDLAKQGFDLSKLKTLKLSIWQPRINNFPEWEVSLTEKNEDGETILEWFAKKSQEAVARSEEAFSALDVINALPSSEIMGAQRVWIKKYLTPSYKGCQWCKAKGFCAARTEDALKSIIAVPEANLDGLEDLDTPVLGADTDLVKGVEDAIARIPTLAFSDLEKAYMALGKIKDWSAGIAEQMHAEMMAGERSKQYKLVMGREGDRKWSSEVEAEELMKSMRLKVDEMYNKKVITAPQAEKVLAKSRPKLWAKLTPLIGRTPGKPVIADISDKRPSIDPYRDALDDLTNLDDGSRMVQTLEDLDPSLNVPGISGKESTANMRARKKTKPKTEPVTVSEIDFI
jgi:hypothetical protein